MDALPEPITYESRRPLRVLQVARCAVESSRRPREGRNHQPVPRRENLVVEMRTGPRCSSRHQQAARLPQHVANLLDRSPGDRCHVVERPRRVQEILAGELALRIGRCVAVRQHAVAGAEHASVGAEHLLDFVIPPDVEGALHLVRTSLVRVLRRDAVGVFGREEPATRSRQVTPNVVERIERDLCVETIAGHLGRLGIGQDELGLVVQHLLEVRHPPIGIDRISMEAASEVVAHSPQCHCPQGDEHHVARAGRSRPRVLPKQEQQLARPWKLRCAAEPASPRIERR